MSIIYCVSYSIATPCEMLRFEVLDEKLQKMVIGGRDVGRNDH